MPTVRWTSPMRRWWSLRKHSRRAKYSRSTAMTLRLTGSAAGIGTMLLKYWDDGGLMPAATLMRAQQPRSRQSSRCLEIRTTSGGCRSLQHLPSGTPSLRVELHKRYSDQMCTTRSSVTLALRPLERLFRSFHSSKDKVWENSATRLPSSQAEAAESDWRLRNAS